MDYLDLIAVIIAVIIAYMAGLLNGVQFIAAIKARLAQGEKGGRFINFFNKGYDQQFERTTKKVINDNRAKS